jgi:integrase/recombinase XerD
MPNPGQFIEKEYTMNKTETDRFNKLYERHLRLLKLDGKSQKTIDGY